MTRLEAQHRIEAAKNILLEGSWTKKDIERLIDGLHREDAVEAIERAAADYLGLAR